MKSSDLVKIPPIPFTDYKAHFDQADEALKSQPPDYDKALGNYQAVAACVSKLPCEPSTIICGIRKEVLNRLLKLTDAIPRFDSWLSYGPYSDTISAELDGVELDKEQLAGFAARKIIHEEMKEHPLPLEIRSKNCREILDYGVRQLAQSWSQYVDPGIADMLGIDLEEEESITQF